jgi:plasmid stabilization system protein ParE
MFRKSWFACMVEIGLRATSGKTMLENSKPVKPIAVSLVASQHLDDIYSWYEKKQVGLGKRFLSGVTTTFQKIQRTPTIGHVTHEPHRRVIMGKFPYVFSMKNKKHKSLFLVLSIQREIPMIGKIFLNNLVRSLRLTWRTGKRQTKRFTI